MVLDDLRALIVEYLQQLGYTEATVILEIPQDPNNGDYTTNVAFQLAKLHGKSPLAVADEIAGILQEHKPEYLEKIEAAAPGFVNFWFSEGHLLHFLAHIAEGNSLIEGKQQSDLIEMIENTSPNTNKPLHIGHLRNMALGESIINLRKSVGHQIISANINNNRGIHIVKAMWAYLQYGIARELSNSIQKPTSDWRTLLEAWVSNTSEWTTPLETRKKPDHFVGHFYVLGATAEKDYPDDVPSQFSDMLVVWENGEGDIRMLWNQMNEWFYEGFRQTHARFVGILPNDKQFDKEWYESDIYESGRQIILDNMESGLFYKHDDGAILANLEKYGLPDKVLIRPDSTTVYMTQDLELARLRRQEDHAHLLAYVVGNEQDLHFKQLFTICEVLGIGNKENFKHISYGMVNLTGGIKMSSREGTVVTADELMDAVRETVLTSYNDVDPDVADQIAIGAIKYWMLKYNPKSNIEYDIAESVSLEGNSGPYVQYTFARTCALLGKVTETINTPTDYTLPKEEAMLVRLLHKYPTIVDNAATMFIPSTLATYLYELAKSYNMFYQTIPILTTEAEHLRAIRISVSRVVQRTLGEGLALLGIPTPERM